MKRVLIIGKDSYIGESLYKWLTKYPDKYNVNLVSPLENHWREEDFSNCEAVIDFAGIAHIMNIKEEMRDLFYAVNRDLTVELAEHSKKQGVKQFIYLSSMNVYGDFCGEVRCRENTNPTSFYGDSKFQGEQGIVRLADEQFGVAIVRPPFVYGRGCKGNYNTISKIAKKTPLFPTYRNKKSMIYIDNLCEFIRLLIDKNDCGIFTPQNKELVSTSELVRAIAKNNGNRIWFTSLFNWLIPVAIQFSKMARRAFADDAYSIELSDYYDFEYCIVDFEKSILESNQL